MEQLLGRQTKLKNKNFIQSLFLFLFFLVTLFVYVFFNCCDENSSNVLTLFVSVFRIK